MPNPFYRRFNNNNQNMGPLGQAQNLRQLFTQFCLQLQGDPREQVQNLLDSGRLTQEQFNQFSNTAKMHENMFRELFKCIRR